MAAIVFGSYPFYQIVPTTTPLQFGLYEAMSRIFWPMALCYIIFACRHKLGGPIDTFLSLPMWQPLSRLSYAIYIVHFPLLTLINSTKKTPSYFSEVTVNQNFISIFVLSTFIAIPMTLAFELPINAINRLITGSNTKHNSNETLVLTMEKYAVKTLK